MPNHTKLKADDNDLFWILIIIPIMFHFLPPGMMLDKVSRKASENYSWYLVEVSLRTATRYSDS